MIFRLYHITQGGHVHCRLFSGKHDGALGKNGDLCFRVEEFAAFREAHPNIQFRPEPSPFETRFSRDPYKEPT